MAEAQNSLVLELPDKMRKNLTACQWTKSKLPSTFFSFYIKPRGCKYCKKTKIVKTLLKYQFSVQKSWNWQTIFESGSFYKAINIFSCSSSGLTAPTNFANCVDGTKVEVYGTPYDFNSIMHYSLYA